MYAFVVLITLTSLALSAMAAPISNTPIDIDTSGGGFKIQVTIDVTGDEKKDVDAKFFGDKFFDKVEDKFDDKFDDKLLGKLDDKFDGKFDHKVDGKFDDKFFGDKAKDKKQLFDFTSTFFVNAIPENVVNGTEPTGGIAGASGTFNFGINSKLNMICYDITLHNFEGDFSSPATTATHIHEAKKGASGPPRISFPNPEVFEHDLTIMNSAGCLKGPFVTGVMVDGKDSGEGFHVSMIEADPAAFMSDTHSSVALAGAVRGQLA